MTQDFVDAITEGYTFEGATINIGAAMIDGETKTGTIVKAPLVNMNKHGLISGATGTGKTKSMQKMVEELSLAGVPTVVMDVKGDVSGLSQPSDGHEKIDERHAAIGLPWEAAKLPVEFLTISDQNGTRLRATVSEFGPTLFSQILNLNETQTSVIALVFKYADDNELPLIDLGDLKKLLQYLTTDGKEEIRAEYGAISPASTNSIMRKIIELEGQGAEVLFGERSFDVFDLLRHDSEGRGMINLLRLTDMQSKPKLFSTFMLTLLAEVYEKFPEVGDQDKPKLVMFIDEAHLIFDEASDSLMDKIEQVIKLIRSKGVGIFFVTQNPVDIPSSVLAQLGMKIQHALRAFTARDRKAIKLAAENYPETDFYNVKDDITQLGTGEAFVSVLGRKGIPSPLVHTMMMAPVTRMDIITDAELDAVVRTSQIARMYNEEIDRESAKEILTERMKAATIEREKEEEVKKEVKVKKTKKKEKSAIEKLSKNTMARQVGRTVAKEVTRGLLGALGWKN